MSFLLALALVALPSPGPLAVAEALAKRMPAAAERAEALATLSGALPAPRARALLGAALDDLTGQEPDFAVAVGLLGGAAIDRGLVDLAQRARARLPTSGEGADALGARITRAQLQARDPAAALATATSLQSAELHAALLPELLTGYLAAGADEEVLRSVRALGPQEQAGVLTVVLAGAGHMADAQRRRRMLDALTALGDDLPLEQRDTARLALARAWRDAGWFGRALQLAGQVGDEGQRAALVAELAGSIARETSDSPEAPHTATLLALLAALSADTQAAWGPSVAQTYLGAGRTRTVAALLGKGEVPWKAALRQQLEGPAGHEIPPAKGSSPPNHPGPPNGPSPPNEPSPSQPPAAALSAGHMGAEPPTPEAELDPEERVDRALDRVHALVSVGQLAAARRLAQGAVRLVAKLPADQRQERWQEVGETLLAARDFVGAYGIVARISELVSRLDLLEQAADDLFMEGRSEHLVALAKVVARQRLSAAERREVDSHDECAPAEGAVARAALLGRMAWRLDERGEVERAATVASYIDHATLRAEARGELVRRLLESRRFEGALTLARSLGNPADCGERLYAREEALAAVAEEAAAIGRHDVALAAFAALAPPQQVHGEWLPPWKLDTAEALLPLLVEAGRQGPLLTEIRTLKAAELREPLLVQAVSLLASQGELDEAAELLGQLRTDSARVRALVVLGAALQGRPLPASVAEALAAIL